VTRDEAFDAILEWSRDRKYETHLLFVVTDDEKIRNTVKGNLAIIQGVLMHLGLFVLGPRTPECEPGFPKEAIECWRGCEESGTVAYLFFCYNSLKDYYVALGGDHLALAANASQILGGIMQQAAQEAAMMRRLRGAGGEGGLIIPR